MTTIAAALAGDGSVVMAADTTTWLENTPSPGTVKTWAHPVLAADGGPGDRSVLVGVAGQAQLKDLLRRRWKLHGVPADNATNDEADDWASACAEGIAGVAADASPPVLEDGGVAGLVLLAYGGRFWSICQQNAAPVYRAACYHAIGSGAPVALGALQMIYLSRRKLSPAVANQLRRAVLAACRWDAWTRVDDAGPTVLTLGPDGRVA